jgi:Tfp pilus assembly protein PilN
VWFSDTRGAFVEINLLPWREEILTFNRNIFVRIMTGAVMIAGIIIFFGYQIYFAPVSYSQGYLHALDEAKTNLTGKITAFLSEKGMQEEVNKRMNVLIGLQRDRYKTIRLLNEFAKITPKGIYLQKIERHGNQVEVMGSTNSNLFIAQFLKDIDASDEMDVTSLQKVEQDEGQNVVVTHFNLLAVLTMDQDKAESTSADKKDEIHNPATEILKMRENQAKKTEELLNQGKK